MNKNDNSSSTNFSLEEKRKRIRHSTAHVMADVVTRMFPKAKLAIGPPTNDGFYYDFLVSKPFTNEDELREILLNSSSTEETLEKLLELLKNFINKIEL